MTNPLTYRCPFCDSEVRVGRSCPGCAKQRKRGKVAAKKPWEQDEAADGLGLPDDDFDYDDFIAREFGRAPHGKLGVKWFWWLLGVVALVAMIAGLVYRLL